MRITLDTSSPIPLGVQITEAIQLAIARRELEPGDQLPTVRQLAVDLRVNSNTVAKVYSELEKAGVLETRRGRGSFVRAQQPARAGQIRARRLRVLVVSFVKICSQEGYSLPDVLAAMRDVAGASKKKEEA